MRRDDWSASPWIASADPTSSTWFKSDNDSTHTAINTLGLAGISITIKPLSGTLNGQFKLQVTDFGATDSVSSGFPVSADWVDYPASTQPSTAGAISASINWQVTDLRSKWLRVVFTDNGSSSPKVAVAITARAFA